MTSVTRGLFALLLASLVVLSSGPAEARSVGHTWAPDGTLRSGCHNYRYHYVIKTPTSDWTLETFLKDPDGQGLASGAYFADSDPRVNKRAHFRFCRYSTRAGVFTIKAKVHWYGEFGDEHVRWLEPSHFRLSR
ncbi:hypothetical protein ABLE68_22230 [Nocardioides sp. CN2-186]|uniref:hypothetical protein n=1 Tax=Nocardioides tweenelious TaxID=3156607 RepID=UPI0032B5DD92